MYFKMNRLHVQEEIVLTNIDKITIDTILEVQKTLEPYDVTSLVFLLYEVPITALERLVTYHRVCKDVGINNLNLLFDWVLHAQSRPSWRYEFLEALAICRLYNVVKKLGFNVKRVKQQFQPENIINSVYINSMKKVLYILSENMTYEHLEKLKKTILISYKIDTTQYEHCEMLFLDLICNKIVVLNQIVKQNKTCEQIPEVEKLAVLIENLRGLEKFAVHLREIVNKSKSDFSFGLANENSAPTTSKLKTDDDFQKQKKEINCVEVKEENKKTDQINSDSLHFHKFMNNIYPISNTKRVGVCCIINQENFHPPKSSTGSVDQVILPDRLGSNIDQDDLEKTMKSLNFIVKIKRNLKQTEVFDFLKECIQFCTQEDSIFILCILSHGVMGHIYSYDSKLVSVEEIQKMLDSEEALHLRNKPKVLILQACRVIEPHRSPKLQLVADGPSNYLKKSHFLIYWATAPEYEAFRDEKMGSIFIRTLCYFLKKLAVKEQLCDICTTVTGHVIKYCTQNKCVQVPVFESTLTKKLYLCLQTSNKLDK